MALLAFFQTQELRSRIDDKVAVGALVCVPVAAWLVARYVAQDADRKKTKKTPGVKTPASLPTTLPIVGDMFEILGHKDHRHDWLTSLCESFGGQPFQLRMPGRPPATVVYTPEAVEDVLKTHFSHIPKGAVQQENFRDVLGHGIFAVDGDQWVHQRKTSSNVFTTRALRDSMTANIRHYTVQLLQIMQRASDSNVAIDIFKLLNRFTIEAFSKMGFGIEMNCLDAEEDHPFQSAFDSSQRILAGRFQRPVWFWKLQRILNVGAEAQLKKDVAVINDTVMKIVLESLARRAKQQSDDNGKSVDIVSLFLDRFDSSGGGRPDPQYLRDIVVNFLIAGRDSTAQAMSWCFYNLSNNPEVVAKIRQELAHFLPELASGQQTSPPTMEQVQQLLYLDATIKETLRLHPSVPFIPKAVAQDTLLSDGTFLRGGTSLRIPTYAMGRMKFIWGEDAREFKPERWFDETTNKPLNVSAFKFIAFNAGPRMCLGMNLAMLEMKIVVASVLARFNVELLPGQHVIYDNSLTLPVKGALLARLTAV